MALEQIGLQAVLQDANFQAGLKRYNSGVGQMTTLTDGAAAAISGAFKIATGALLVGAGAAVAILGTSLKAAADAEQVAAATDAVLKSTKGVAGMTTQAVTDLATALSEVTPFEDDAVQGAENLLLTFTGIGKNVFPLATETMLDLSQAMGQDLKSSAVQLGKALNNPAEGLSALQRVGVTFTKQQEDLVKKLVATGKTEEAQRVILKELQTEFGGAAKAAGKTFAGQMQILQNSIGNVQEEIGGALLPIAQELVRWITANALPRLKDLSRWFTTEAIPRFRELAARYLPPLIAAFRSLAAWVTVNVLPQLQRLTDWIRNDAIPFVRRLADAFRSGGLLGVVGQLATEFQNAWPIISAALSGWGTKFWDWLTGKGGALEQVGAKVGQLVTGIADWLANPANQKAIWDTLTGWAGRFWGWVTDPSGVMATTAGNLVNIVGSIRDWLNNPANTQPIWDFIDPWVNQFWGWVTDPNKGLLVTVATEMGKLAAAIETWTNDPETQKRFAQIGTDLAQYIMDGMGRLFSDQGKGDSLMNRLWRTLLQADRNIWNAMVGIGRDISTAILSGLASFFTDPVTAQNFAQSIITMMQNAINAVLAQLPGIFKPLSDAWFNFFAGLGGTPTPPPVPGTGPAPQPPEGYQHGGYVPRDMLARLHAGEYVLPAAQVSRVVNNNQRMIGAGAVVINFPAGTTLSRADVEEVTYRAVRRVMDAA